MKKNNFYKLVIITFLLFTIGACSPKTTVQKSDPKTPTVEAKAPKEAIEKDTTTAEKQPDKRGFLIKMGDQSPDFAMTLTDGRTVNLAQLQAENKVIMLQFTASWCGVCRKEMPFIEVEIWEKYKDKGLIVIGVDRDEPLETVLKFVKQTKVTYPIALDPNADIFGLFASKESGVTRNIIIDQTGKIAYITRLFNRVEFDEMKEVIADLLVEN